MNPTPILPPGASVSYTPVGQMKQLPPNTAISSLPVDQRLQYLDPNQDPNHPDLKRTDFTCRCADTAKAAETERTTEKATLAALKTDVATLAQSLTQVITALNKLTASAIADPVVE